MAASIEALDAELRGGGALDAHGEFTIDADKARDKLRRFQLAVPQHYVLLLVQALVLRGATAIAVRIDGDDVHLSADGDAFSADELGDLNGAIFTEARDPRRLSHHYLALGLGAAMSLDPRWIKVVSGGAELTQRSNQPDALHERDSAPLAGTTIHIRDRLHPRILVRMWSREEAEILRRRCHLSDTPITLNGAPISRGLALPASARCIEAVDLPAHGPHSAAIIGIDLSDPDREAAVELVTAGAWIATHKLPLPRGFIARVRADLLGKDVSQADVVRDAAYHEVLAAATTAGLRALDRLIDLIDSPVGAVRYNRHHLTTWLFSQASTELPTAIAAAPERYPPARLGLWRTLGGANLSTLDLLGDHSIRVLYSPPELLLPELADILLVDRAPTTVGQLPADDDDTIDASAFLRICFGARLVDASPIVRRVVARERGRRAFLSRPHPPGLESGAYRDRERFSAGELVRGEVGLRLAGSVRPVLRIILEGNILEELTLPGPCAGLVVVLVAPADPQEDYSGALRTPALAAALLPAIAAIERLLARVAAAPGADEALREQLLDYALATTQPSYLEDLLFGCGFPRPLAREIAGSADQAALRPAWGLGADAPHPLLQLPLFTSSDPGAVHRLTLQQLADVARERPPLWWMPTTPRASDRPVLVLDARRRALITALLGPEALSDYSPTARALLIQQQLMERPIEPVTIGPALLEIPFTHGPIQGVIGLPLPDAKREKLRDTAAHVHVYCRDRPLYRLSLPCLLPNIAAAFNDNDAPLRERGNAPPPTPALTAAFERAVPHLLAELAQRAERGPLHGQFRALLLATPPAVYSSHEHYQAHRQLIQQHGAELGDQRFAAFLELASQYTRGRIRDELNRVVSGKHPLDLDDLRARLVRARKSATPAPGALQAQLIPALRSVLAAPTLTLAGGASCSLADVIAWSANKRSIYLISPSDAADLDPEALARAAQHGALLLADDPVRAALSPLLGDQRLLDADKILAALRQRSRFHARPQVEVVALPDHRYLAKIALTGAITGELGLLPVQPAPKPASTFHIYYQRRRVTSLGSEAIGLPLVGALEVHESELAPDLSGLGKGAGGRISALCRRHAAELRHHLAATFTARADGEDRQLAAAWLLHTLAERITAAGAALDLTRLRRDPLITAILELPLLRRADGEPTALHHLLEATAEAPLVYVTAPLPAAGDALLVPQGDSSLEIILRALFPQRRDVTEDFLRSPAARERQRLAPMLAAGAPASALASRKITRDDLHGALWIPPLTPQLAEHTAVALGDAGKQVARLHPDPYLLCEGALSGAAVVVDSEWQAAPLDRKPLRAIRRAAIALWRELIAEYRRYIERLTRGERDLGPRFVQLRDALWIQLMHLHAAAGDALDEPLRELTAELRQLPLLPLQNRRLLSLDHALSERPAELLGLGLWQPPAAPTPAETIASDPAASSAPTSPSAPPAPTPEELLLEAVREELRRVRDPGQGALTDAHLISLALGSGTGSQLLIEHRGLYLLDLRHPLIRAACERRASDPLLVSLVASAAYTYLNLKLADIEDHDEAAFHAHHARHLLTAL